MADHLGITLEHIEYSFDTCRGKTATQALLDYRLNRLCDQMWQNPSEEIGTQIVRCRLPDFQNVSIAFESYFGIDIIEYHRQCFLAAASKYRKVMHEDSADEELVGDSTYRILGETKLHCIR